MLSEKCYKAALNLCLTQSNEKIESCSDFTPRIYKEEQTERAILLCKLNKSMLESSISVGIQYTQVKKFVFLKEPLYIFNKPLGPKNVKKLFVYYVIS